MRARTGVRAQVARRQRGKGGEALGRLRGVVEVTRFSEAQARWPGKFSVGLFPAASRQARQLLLRQYRRAEKVRAEALDRDPQRPHQ